MQGRPRCKLTTGIGLDWIWTPQILSGEFRVCWLCCSQQSTRARECFSFLPLHICRQAEAFFLPLPPYGSHLPIIRSLPDLQPRRLQSQKHWSLTSIGPGSDYCLYKHMTKKWPFWLASFFFTIYCFAHKTDPACSRWQRRDPSSIATGSSPVAQQCSRFPVSTV